MFCNGPEMDGGDTAYLGPTIIIEMTIPRCQSSSAVTLDDSGGLAGPITIRLPSLSLSNYHHKNSTNSGLADMQMLRGDKDLKKYVMKSRVYWFFKCLMTMVN